MNKKKRQDAFKAKERKQKMIAIGGSVLLVGLLAFQVPRVMKQINRGKGGPPAVPAAVATPPVGSVTPPLAAPTLRGQEQPGAPSTAAAPSTTGGGLVLGSDGAAQGQLASFSRFASKDPFSQQVQGAKATPSSSADNAAPTTSGGGTTPSGSGSVPSGSQPAPGSAVISVNGTLMEVAVGTDFPQPTPANASATPLFHLISLTATTAKISIVGGSYTTGAPAVTLRVNKAVTLVNTADGARFKLILKPQGTPLPGASDPGTQTPTVTLPAATP